MKAKQFARVLDGRQYNPNGVLTLEELEQAKELGLFVLSWSENDDIKIEGYFNDEVKTQLRQNQTIFLTKKGITDVSTAYVDILWMNQHYVPGFHTNIPYWSFDICDGDKVISSGLLIDVLSIYVAADEELSA